MGSIVAGICDRLDVDRPKSIVSAIITFHIRAKYAGIFMILVAQKETCVWFALSPVFIASKIWTTVMLDATQTNLCSVSIEALGMSFVFSFLVCFFTFYFVAGIPKKQYNPNERYSENLTVPPWAVRIWLKPKHVCIVMKANGKWLVHIMEFSAVQKAQ